MKTITNTLGGFAAGALILACAAATRPAAGAGDVTPVVLGTFDSRSVAIAYANSEAFDAYLAGLHEQLEQARADGDDVRAAELEALGPALQERMHEQGFSTASVAGILEHVRGELPALADEAGVDVIVSQWDIAWRRDGAQVVDVTDALVAAFEPDARGLRSAREIREHDPVPADELRHDH